MQALEDALAALTVHQMPVPQAFQWTNDGSRGGRTQFQLEAQWPTMPLEERVSLTACLIGYPVLVPESRRLVSDAYLALCRCRTLQQFCEDMVPA